ncbi:Aldehyde dehydrogenase 8 member A1 [Lunasporangiospora selenospora]|uniref:Aldehyde dehydrogenase 8 member A1 n=1 Tax=Lunasporangiospora selenospora TaxID=979761 RepID=A0A9P6FZY7_9FUNG|nr:Aldehyde dehydrogenase 8 member A1 [Lunasporangiospora selenospora]
MSTFSYSESTPAAMSLITIDNFINNAYVKPQNGIYFDTFEPSRGRPYAKIPDSAATDVELAYKAAASAFPAWSKTSAAERSNIMNKIANLLESRLDEFAEAESRDQGKPVELARTVDIPRAIHNFRFYASKIIHATEEAGELPGVGLSYTQRMPVGVAGLISPWNLPLYLLTWKIAPCIASGNTAVCKPSEFTSMTAFLLCSVFIDAGLPTGVVNMVFGTGMGAGQAIVDHPRIPLISFTGGTVTGAKIIANSAKHFKKLSLELGGKNANIVFADSNLEAALNTSVRSSFANQGEICLCGSRIFVERPVYQQFLDGLVARAKNLKVGDPRSKDTNLGALVSREHWEKVTGYIQLSLEEGGKIECGGQKPSSLQDEFKDGYFLEPTIISGLTPQCRVMREEIFGPVVTIYPFDTEEEVIQLANDSVYGLSCSVWTENIRRARRVAGAIQAGTVWVNTWMARDLRMPFGGMKQSGLGREGGDHSLNFYSEIKTICLAD